MRSLTNLAAWPILTPTPLSIGPALANKFIDQVGTNPDAGRASNDLRLDIIAHRTVRRALFQYE